VVGFEKQGRGPSDVSRNSVGARQIWVAEKRKKTTGFRSFLLKLNHSGEEGQQRLSYGRCSPPWRIHHIRLIATVSRQPCFKHLYYFIILHAINRYRRNDSRKENQRRILVSLFGKFENLWSCLA